MPKVSVVMPVYNCVAYIKQSVESILAQTFTDFEFFIIDDHSTDGTYEYLQTLTDARIQLIRKPQNSGYTVSLNMGLDMAKGEYVARMDGDDIALPERFAKQVSFMDNRKDVAVCGTCYRILGTDTIIQMPLTNEAAKIVSIMHVPVAHPTVFIRHSVLTNHQFIYNEKLAPAEDYDLWTRILEVGKIENLPEVLLLYRQHSQQESMTKYKNLIESAVEIRQKQLSKSLHFSHKKYSVLFAISVLTKQPEIINASSIKKIATLLVEMEKNNAIKKVYDSNLLYNYLRQVWLFYIKQFNQPKISDIKLLINIATCKVTRMPVIFYIKFLKNIIIFSSFSKA